MGAGGLKGAQGIDAREAAGLFKQLQAKTSAKLIVGNLAVTPSMVPWFNEFKSACSGCHWHAVGIHPYDASPMYHVGKIKAVADGKPIWLTEFNAGSGDHPSYIRKHIPEFEGSSDIEGYLWAISSHSHYLSHSNGELTEIGRAFDEVLSGSSGFFISSSVQSVVPLSTLLLLLFRMPTILTN